MEKAGNTMVTKGSRLIWPTQDKPTPMPPDRTHTEDKIPHHFGGISAQSALLESNPNKTAGKPKSQTFCKIRSLQSSDTSMSGAQSKLAEGLQIKGDKKTWERKSTGDLMDLIFAGKDIKRTISQVR